MQRGGIAGGEIRGDAGLCVGFEGVFADGGVCGVGGGFAEIRGGFQFSGFVDRERGDVGGDYGGGFAVDSETGGAVDVFGEFRG